MQANEITVKKPTAWWKLAINITVPLLLIFVFAREIAKSWPEIRHYHWSMDWRLAILAILVLCVNSLIEILIWNKTLSWFTAPLPFNQVTPIYIWSSLARYVPGKVFSLVLRAGLCAQVQCGIIPAMAASTVELALRTASGFLLLCLVLIGSAAPHEYLIIPLITVPLVLICAHPRIMLPVMNWVLAQIKQQRIEKSLRYRDVLFVFMAILCRWVIYGLGMTLLATAIDKQAFRHFLALIGAAAGSWSAGFVGFAPGGVGVTEWAQKYLFEKSLHFTSEVSLILPVLFRLATLVAEGLWALASVFFRRTWSTGITEVTPV